MAWPIEAIGYNGTLHKSEAEPSGLVQSGVAAKQTNPHENAPILSESLDLLIPDISTLWGELGDIRQPFDSAWMPVGGGRYERKNGAQWPFFWTEPQLDLLRSASRFVAGYNGGHGAGFIGSYCGYIIGKGMICKGVPVDDTDPDGDKRLIAELEKELQEFSDRTSWPELQQETFNSSLIDGDTAIWMFDLGDHLEVRRIGGEYIRQPMSRADVREWGFGVHTPPDDVKHHLGYYVWDQESIEGHYVEAADMAYFPFARPGGWDSTIRRGMPIFMGCGKESADCAAKILRNMGQGVAIRQAVAWIEEQASGTSREETASDADFRADVLARDPLGSGKTKPVRKITPGYTPKIPEGYKFVNPPGHPETESAISVVDALIRSVCSMLSCPGWMAGESGRNQGSYEKDLLKVAPMVKTGEMRQEFFGNRFLKICRRVVQIAVRCGRLRPETLTRLRLTMEHPEIASEDKAQQANVNKTYVDMKVKSKTQVQSEIGLDPAKQKAEIEAEAKWEKESGAEQGQGGVGGAAQPGGAAPGNPSPPIPDPGAGANPFESQESDLSEHGDPPFPGAIFDDSSHRWKKPGEAASEPQHGGDQAEKDDIKNRMGHLLNGMRVYAVGMTKNRASAMLKDLRSQGIFAVRMRDPQSRKVFIAIPERQTEGGVNDGNPPAKPVETPAESLARESRADLHEEGDPPFPGAVFDKASHRWKKPGEATAPGEATGSGKTAAARWPNGVRDEAAFAAEDARMIPLGESWLKQNSGSVNSLRTYIENSSDINSEARTNPNNPADWGPDAQAVLKSLDAAPAIPGGVVVMRGVQFYDEDAAKFTAMVNAASESGDLIQFAGFQSTTLSPEIAENFSNDTVLEIKAYKGGYLDDHIPDSTGESQNQKEMLLQHGSAFRVVEVTEGEYLSGLGKNEKRKIIRLEQVPDVQKDLPPWEPGGSIRTVKNPSRFSQSDLIGTRVVAEPKSSHTRESLQPTDAERVAALVANLRERLK